MEDFDIGKEKIKRNDLSIRIKSIQANSLYNVNSNIAGAYLDLGEAVINDSLFAVYMRKHGVIVTNRNKSKDFIVLKFDYGIKGGLTAKELRDHYYQNGASVTWKIYGKEGNVLCEETIGYKMLMRNPGKAKEGECTFIRDNLYDVALKYITMDLYDRLPAKNAKIVELSAYSTLTTATALEYITIPMKNIFIVKDEIVSAMIRAASVKARDVPYEKEVIDYESMEELINGQNLTFYKKKEKDNPQLKYIKKTKAALLDNKINYITKKIAYYKKECYVERIEEKTEVTNTLWDGMGLIDESIFPENMEGFIYCRSHFFKSCLFRGNIQEYFRDYYGDGYESALETDMFGNKIKVSDIKVIITENSIKWIKFIDLMGGTEAEACRYYKRFMKKHKEQFSIVKTAHSSKWGELQRGSYQIYNSLPCTDKETLTKIAKISVDYCNQLKTNHRAFLRHLSINKSKRYSINNVLIALDEWNDDFKYTDYFKAKKNDIISRFKIKRLKQGKLLEYGDNLTICGNPVALLMKVTGQDFLKEQCFKTIDNGIQCYTTRFNNGEKLAGFRSPHNSPCNIIHLVNTYSEPVQTYFPELGRNVIIINGIGTDVQSRLNGQDLDTDGIYATNQVDIVKLAEYAYLNYPTIVNHIAPLETSQYDKDMKSYAKMDNRISSSQFAIGYASNIAQLALSYYYNDGSNNKELENVFIICSVLAQIGIDSAKRSFEINVNSELKRLNELPCMKRDDGVIYPKFYADIQKSNNERKRNVEIMEEKIGRFDCPMEILAEIVEENIIDLRKYKESIPYTCNLNVAFQYNANGKRDSKQHKKIIKVVQEYDSEIKKLKPREEDYSKKVSMKFDDCMNKINKLSVNKGTMSSLIAYAFTENGDIRDRLLTVLYDKDAKCFLDCFKKQQKLPEKVRKALIYKGIQNLSMRSMEE